MTPLNDLRYTEYTVLFLLLRALFGREEAFATLLRRIRWKNTVYCPHCGATHVHRYGWYGVYQKYQCQACLQYFNDKTGTPLHYSRIPPWKWLLGAFLFVYIHTPIQRIAHALDTSYTTAFHLTKTILHACHTYVQARLQHMQDTLVGLVEIDETYVTAGLKGRHNHQRIQHLQRDPRHRGKQGTRGRGTYDQDRPPIVCMLARSGEVLLFSTHHVRTTAIKPLVDLYVQDGSIVITDEFKTYTFLGEETAYQWHHVNHGQHVYARETCDVNAHINTVEAVFSYLDPFLEMHRGIAKYNLQQYLSLFTVHRELKDQSFSVALTRLMEIVFCHPKRVEGSTCP